MTIDEVREQRGREALPDGLGEQLYVPFNTVPIDELANRPTQPPATTPSSTLHQTPPTGSRDGEDECARG